MAVEGVGVLGLLCGALEHIQQLAHFLLESLYSVISNSVLFFEDLFFHEEIVSFSQAGDRSGCVKNNGAHTVSCEERRG